MTSEPRLGDVAASPGSQAGRQSPGAGRGRGTLPWNLQRELSPASTWVQTSSLRDHERIDFCCFKPPS